MKRADSTRIKVAPGKCKLRVIETPTRDAIVSDTGTDTVTIAYVAIGAEAWGPLLSAAPDMADALRRIRALAESPSEPKISILLASQWASAAIAKATKP